MDQFGRLGSALLFFLAILQLLEQCAFQLTLNIEVSGEYVVKTGIRTYTRSHWYNYVVIRCSSPVSVPANVSLFDSEGEIDTSETGIPFVQKTVYGPVGKYYCVLNTAIRVSNDSCYNFSVWSEVEITTEWKWPMCASSIGNSAHEGEKAVLNCTIYYDNYCRWDNTRTNVIEVFLTENTVSRTCACFYTSCRYSSCPIEPGCSLSIQVFRSIHLNISISTNVTNSNSSVMEFLCMSTPPRLINWKVIGIHSDILDLDNLNQSMKVSTTVNITQSPGETRLRIWEAIPGGNCIHTVMCYTYDTEKRVVAFRHITTPSECSFDCGSISFKTTARQETTSANPTTTDASSTLVVSTTEEGRLSKVFDVASTDQNYEMNTDTINDYVLIGFVSLPYLVLILILIGIICYMHCRHKSKMEVSTEVPTQHTLPEAILHDNPAYLSFSETKDYIPKKENEENELTYANL